MENKPTIHGTGTKAEYTLKDYYPLIFILLLVLVMSALSSSVFAIDHMLAFMGWFFIIFGGLKVARLHSFVQAYRMYDIPAKHSKVYAYLFPFIELGTGLAFLFNWQIKIVSLIMLPILLVSALGVYLKIRQKEVVPCACLGTVFTVPMTYVTLGEDLIMALMMLPIIFN